MAQSRALLALESTWAGAAMFVGVIGLFVGVFKPSEAFRTLTRSGSFWIKGPWVTSRPASAAGSVYATKERLTPAGTVLPRVVHRVLRPEEVKPRVIIVGDIHGCLDELRALLDQLSFHPTRDSVILVGDLVNKGPKSAEVVRFARESGFFSVRGNHDDSALAAFYRVGKFTRSVPPAYDYVRSFSKEDVEWMDQLPYTITLPPSFDSAMVVHAGLLPGAALPEQTASNMSRMRNVEPAEDGRMVAHEAVKTGRAWAEVWQGPQHIYFGHDAKRGLQQAAFATGLDTGACYGRSLTAAVLPSKEIVSLRAFKVYVKPDKP